LQSTTDARTHGDQSNDGQQEKQSSQNINRYQRMAFEEAKEEGSPKRACVGVSLIFFLPAQMLACSAPTCIKVFSSSAF
jgi:hypothetical protein